MRADEGCDRRSENRDPFGRESRSGVGSGGAPGGAVQLASGTYRSSGAAHRSFGDRSGVGSGGAPGGGAQLASGTYRSVGG